MNNISMIIVQKLLILPGILLGISVHEFAHAYMAYKLGDESQKFRGRLTINPTKHLDPIGFILLLVVGFGWAKPVMIDSRYFKNPKKDDIKVSLAGPVANLIVALITAVFLGLMIGIFARMGMSTSGQTFSIIIMIFKNMIWMNLILLVFNLIPIPPLDGHHILADIGGYKVQNFYNRYANYWSMILIILVVMGAFSYIILPIVSVLNNLMLEIAQVIITVLVI